MNIILNIVDSFYSRIIIRSSNLEQNLPELNRKVEIFEITS